MGSANNEKLFADFPPVPVNRVQSCHNSSAMAAALNLEQNYFEEYVGSPFIETDASESVPEDVEASQEKKGDDITQNVKILIKEAVKDALKETVKGAVKEAIQEAADVIISNVRTINKEELCAKNNPQTTFQYTKFEEDFYIFITFFYNNIM